MATVSLSVKAPGYVKSWHKFEGKTANEAIDAAFNYKAACERKKGVEVEVYLEVTNTIVTTK